MRLNRGNLALLGVSLLVVVAVLLFGNQASAPAPTPTPITGEKTPLFPDVVQDDVMRFALYDNLTGQYTVLERSAQDIWSVSDTTAPAEYETNQVQALGTMGVFASLVADSSFAPEDVSDFDPATFGLDNPAYTLLITTADQQYTLYLGDKNPGSTRYYAMRYIGEPFEVRPQAQPEATAEATAEASSEPAAAVEMKTSDPRIYLVSNFELDNMIKLITTPPYVIPTATPSPFPTANPYSEVDQTATATAQVAATLQALTAAAEVTPEATTEATAEATAAP